MKLKNVLCIIAVMLLTLSISVVSAQEVSKLGTYNEGGFAQGVAVRGDIVCLSDGYKGFKIIDVSDPHNPSELDSFSTGNYAVNSVIVDREIVTATGTELRTYCYGLGYNQLYILDITGGLFNQVGLISGGTTWSDIRIVGNYVYVAGKPQGLAIIDVSNPSNPTLINSWNIGGDINGLDVVSQGGRILAYLADDRRVLDIIDVTDPYNIKRIASWNNGGQSERVVVYNNIIYLAEELAGLRILRLEEPENQPAYVVELGAYAGSYFANGITVSGKYAYLSDTYQGMKILDVSNPSNIAVKYVIPNDPYGCVESKVSGSRLYITRGAMGLEIYDISDFVTIPCVVDIAPGTLNLKSQGNFVTAYISLPDGYNAADIDVGKILLTKINGLKTTPVLSIAEGSPSEIGDYNEDLVPDLMVKFSRQELQEKLIIPAGEKETICAITISGELISGSLFEGTSTIRVIDSGQQKKK